MSELTISANTYEEALAEGLKQLGVPREALDVEVMQAAHDDTLPGAEPLPGTTVRLRIKPEVLVRTAKEHLKRMLALMGIEAHIEVLNRSRGTILNIMAGDDGALIIGRAGQTLEALQYVLNRMVVKGGRELTPPIIVDSEAYKEKRISRLEDLAKRTASRVLRQGREVALEPMPPQDRKIIHLTLKEMRGVHTISRGEEGQRYVVVSPAGRELSPGQSQAAGGERRGHRGRGDRDRDRPPRSDANRRPQPIQPHTAMQEQFDEEEDDNFGNR